MSCLTVEQLRRFLDAKAPAPAATDVVRHLLDCGECRDRAESLVSAPNAAPAGARVLRHPRSLGGKADAYDAAFARCRDRVRMALGEVESAAGRVEELLAHPRERRALAATQRRFSSLALVEGLLVHSREAKFSDPLEAVALAELALAILDRLDPAAYGRSLLDVARGRAWTAVGAGHRWRSDLEAAERALGEAQRWLADCPDPVAVGVYFHFLAGLRIDQRRFTEARAHLRRAIELYRDAGDDARVVRALTTLGSSYTDEGDPAEALAVLVEALEKVDEAADPRTAFYARHCVALALVELGEPDQAEPLAAACRRWAEAQGDRYLAVRGRWLDGLLATARRDFMRAEAILLEARDEFTAHGMGYEAALVELDCAVVLAEQGRTAEVRGLARSAAAAFVAQGIHREAAGALGLLCRAAEQERASAALVASVARFIRRARFQPEARFDDPR